MVFKVIVVGNYSTASESLTIDIPILQARRHWGAGGQCPPIICQTCFWRCYKRSLIWQQFWQQFILAIHAPHSSSAVYGPAILQLVVGNDFACRYPYPYEHLWRPSNIIRRGTCPLAPPRPARHCYKMHA